jgi:hypothetical protein
MSPEKKHRHSYAEKRAWIIKWLEDKRSHWERTHTGDTAIRQWICATDEDTQRAWEAAFGGKTHIYTIGPSVSPGLARTLRRMFEAGDLVRVTSGNQDARYYCQKTYCVSYALAKTPPAKE